MQAILALKLPIGVRQLRHLLGMVQYYRDLWARQSNVLAPLTSLVGVWGQTKVTKANGTKKVPWCWNEVHQRAFDDIKATIAKDVVFVDPLIPRDGQTETDSCFCPTDHPNQSTHTRQHHLNVAQEPHGSHK